MRRVTICLFVLIVGVTAPGASPPPETVNQALERGWQAREALMACQRYLNGWLAHRDPASGLIPRNLTRDWYWNAQDSAADNYPFMVLTASLLDRPRFDTTMHAMLYTEQRLTNRVGALPDTYDFATQDFLHPEVSMQRLIFGGSEYVKDGLTPLIEWLGHSPWFDRMIAITDDIWSHADVETAYGRIPTENHEINGEQMQVLVRLYYMTGDERYREWAFRLADYYFLNNNPAEWESLQLDDHSCEVFDGLAGAYFLAHHTDAERKRRYQPEMTRLVDRVLEVGVNKDGFVYNRVNARTGEVLNDELSDNFGYNYNAILNVGLLDDRDDYVEATRQMLKALPDYLDYPWEGRGADGYADAIEGALNLYNRLPVPEARQWIDESTAFLLAKVRPDGVVEGWHGDGNMARTALMTALWKSQGVTLHPWRADMVLGAVQEDDGRLVVAIRCDWPWRGTIRFDQPRHRVVMNLPSDYPRINQFPEWFTVESGRSYGVVLAETPLGPVEGKVLSEGLEVILEPGVTHVLEISPQ